MKSQNKKLEISYFLICLKKRHISLCSRAADLLLFHTQSVLSLRQIHYKISFNRRESIFYNAKLQNVCERLRK